jgi:hypothetical protein
LARTTVPDRVSVVPEPPKERPVVPPEKVKLLPVSPPPVFPVMVMELAAGDADVQVVPFEVRTFPLDPAATAVMGDEALPIRAPVRAIFYLFLTH